MKSFLVLISSFVTGMLTMYGINYYSQNYDMGNYLIKHQIENRKFIIGYNPNHDFLWSESTSRQHTVITYRNKEEYEKFVDKIYDLINNR